LRLFPAAGQTKSDPSGPSSLANVVSLHAARHFDDNIILIDRHKVILSRPNAVFKAAKFGETAADAASSSQQRGAGIYFQGCCSNGAQVPETASYSNNFSGATVSR
jgi:hypothetical protein